MGTVGISGLVISVSRTEIKSRIQQNMEDVKSNERKTCFNVRNMMLKEDS